MSETEIAREMNLACSTVCEHRKRALKMMKEAMKNVRMDKESSGKDVYAGNV